MSTYAQQLIDAELEYQKTKGATPEADARQSLGDFIVYADTYLGLTKKAYSGFPVDEAHARAVKEFVKVGALVHAFLNSRA